MYITIKQQEGTLQKLLNKIIWIYLNRAYTQMERSGDLQNGDKVAEFIEDYYTYFVKKQLTFEQNEVIIILTINNKRGHIC